MPSLMERVRQLFGASPADTNRSEDERQAALRRLAEQERRLALVDERVAVRSGGRILHQHSRSDD